MKNLRLIPTALILLFSISCDKTGEPVKDVKGILTSRPWYFFSIDGMEAYDCNKQTNMRFLENGTLEIDGYVREPDYTCSGPHRYTYQYTLVDNNRKIEWEGEAFTIVKLTDTEFIKSVKRDGKDHVWVYRR